MSSAKWRPFCLGLNVLTIIASAYQDPLLLTWINFNPTWISIQIRYKMRDVITYPFPNFNAATVEFWEWISNFTDTLLGVWLLIRAGTKVKPCQ